MDRSCYYPLNSLILLFNRTIFSFFSTSLCVVLAVACSACGYERPKALKPVASYLQGQVLVIMDAQQWQAPLGEALRHGLAAPMPGMPQPEPVFDLLHISPDAFNPLLQRSAAVLFVWLTDSQSHDNQRLKRIFSHTLAPLAAPDSSRLHFFHDMYAKGQQVALLVAPSSAAAVAYLSHGSGAASLCSYFEQLEYNQLIKKLAIATNDTLGQGLFDRHGLRLDVPKTYTLVKDTTHFVWMRYLSATVDKNIFIHSAPYTDSTVFFDAKRYRTAITHKYLRDSQKPWLYITVQDEMPFYSQAVSLQGCYAWQTRGLWKLSDNSIGGPFVSYLIPYRMRLYYMETFLYRAGHKKRDVFREMEAILRTVRITCTP